MMKKVVIALLSIISSFQFIYGQERDTSGVRQTFVIQYDLQIEIDSALRPYQNFPDDVKKVDGKVTPQTYSSKEFDVKLKDENPKIRVYKVKPVPQDDLYGHYIKLGYGPLYTTPYVEVLTNSKRNKKYQYGAYFHHMSSAKGSVDKKNSGQSTNQLEVFGKRFWKKQTLSANIGYTRNRFNYYGYNQELGIGERDVRDSIKQVYQNIYGDFVFDGVDTSKRLTNKKTIGGYYTSDYFKANEWAVYLKNRIRYKMDNGKITAPVDFYYSPYSDDTLSQNRIYINAKPTYESKVGKRITYGAGLNFVYDNDDYQDAKNLHFYPVLYGAYMFNQIKAMSVYLKVDGGMKRNSFKEFAKENPFLNRYTNIRNTNTKLNLELGSKGYLAKGFKYNGFVAYKKVQNLSLFLNDSLDQSKFNIVYEDKVGDQFTAKLGLTYSKNKKYDLGVVAQYDYYNLPSFEKAYHLPAFTGKVLGGYKILPKLKGIVEFYYMTGLYGYDFVNSEDKKLGNIADLNIGLEYFVNDKLSVFGDFNNLLNKDYERYFHYNTKKFNFILGLSYGF